MDTYATVTYRDGMGRGPAKRRTAAQQQVINEIRILYADQLQLTSKRGVGRMSGLDTRTITNLWEGDTWPPEGDTLKRYENGAGLETGWIINRLRQLDDIESGKAFDATPRNEIETTILDSDMPAEAKVELLIRLRNTGKSRLDKPAESG